MTAALDLVKQKLVQALEAGKGEDAPYAVPGLWIDPDGSPNRRLVNPYRFFLERIHWIEAHPCETMPQEPLVTGENPSTILRTSGGEWSRHAVIYNTLVRSATGFDHDGDGEVGFNPVGDGWMETGTFLKAIATLPYVKSLGFNTIHLLPITAVGEDGHKGTLGSIYAIQNPYRLDSRLAEPALGFGAETEFAAFVKAAHLLGLRVVVEFAFRTASRDADWVAEHPEWFYWIRADVPDRQAGEWQAESRRGPHRGHYGEDAYGSPIFTPEELAQINERVWRKNFDDLIPPHSIYREMFAPPPRPENVRLVEGRWIGTLDDGTRARIPGAFADWPPDDTQPPWSDVTYLRLYDHPDFDYIAYNTLRMYDSRLAQPENRVEPLWERIIGILPHYQRSFGIDGVMIDMGHALPMTLKQRMVDAARQINPDFGFWDENFNISRESRDEGYNAVIGNYWWMAYRPHKLVDEMLYTFAEAGYPIPFFAAPESHNTPRAAARPGGLPYARLTWALGCLLPTLPFCHAGFEICETFPVNTGLDFQPDELSNYPAERLPLFSQAAYGWERQPNLVAWVRRTLAIRARYADLIADPDPATVELLRPENPHVRAVIRRRGERAIGIIFNLDWEARQICRVRLPTARSRLSDLLSNGEFSLEEGWLQAEFGPARCVVVLL